MEKEELNEVVIDAMSDFYNKMLKNCFDKIDKSIEAIGYDSTDLKLSNEALVKIVEYSKLQAKVVELEQRLNKISDFEERLSKLEKQRRIPLPKNK